MNARQVAENQFSVLNWYINYAESLFKNTIEQAEEIGRLRERLRLLESEKEQPAKSITREGNIIRFTPRYINHRKIK
ncbi:hypothetical protein [uncultured Bacteroides sp.]|uniref:hypothetical protein n=1 Tax=uncultured Bacteroides sp. TaxID=162156 RepID=UPI00262DAB25|nr:hypothetical protein [uncultured Bacteroides sp.]